MPTSHIPDKYVSLYTDYGFKRIFGTESNKELLRDFLNALLNGEEHIESLELMSQEQLGDLCGARKAVFDVYCRNNRSEAFIVEMQCAQQKYFKDRALFYATFPIREQACKGPEWNFKLSRIYAIGIMNFTFDDKPGYLHSAMLSDIETKEVFYDKLKFLFIEMPKFQKTDNELSSLSDKWLYALKHLAEFEERPAVLDEPIFSLLFQEAKLANFTREELTCYEESLKIARDNHNVLVTSFENGEIKGFKEGKQRGIEEGTQQCLERIKARLADMGMPAELFEKLSR